MDSSFLSRPDIYDVDSTDMADTSEYLAILFRISF